jgi:phosphoserine phosphatase
MNSIVETSFALMVQAPDIPTAMIKEIARLSGARGIDAVPGTETQCFRLEHAGNQSAVAAYCATAGVDFAFVPYDQRLERIGLLAMDMDSTLITIECIDELADMHGIKPEIAAITDATMRGQLAFTESVTRRIALLAGLEVAAMQRVYDERVKLSPGAERLLARARSIGAKTVLVSGGFTFFTDRLAQRLAFDCSCANELEIVEGKLTGRILGPIIDGRGKAACVARLAAESARPGSLVVAIGDGANDLPMMQQADISVAYHAKPIVREKTTYAIDNCGLDAVLNLFIA